MILPNANSAIVEREKVLEYLLNAAHPDNGGKAAFFSGLGFYRNDWQGLVTAFVRLAETTQISTGIESPHGWKYVVDGRIKGTNGKTGLVRTIWIVDRGKIVPRLVTAYPHKD
jgi:hypothetical protein